jgi:hypothetical protein
VAATVVRNHPPNVDRFAVAVLVAIATFADVDGRGAYPTLRTLAPRASSIFGARRGVGAVRAALIRLEDAHALIVVHRGVDAEGRRLSNGYIVCVGPWRDRWRPPAAGRQGPHRVHRERSEDIGGRLSAHDHAHAQRDARRGAARKEKVGPRAGVDVGPRAGGRAQEWGRAQGAARRETAGAARIPKQNPLQDYLGSSQTQGFAREAPSDPPRPRPREFTGHDLAEPVPDDSFKRNLEAARAALRAGTEDAAAVPDHLAFTVNKAGPADRRRRRA